MKYLSVCSGIEAATVAWHSLGWEAAAYSEIEPFPSAVLAHHYPTVPNVGDMTKFKEWNIEPGTVDLLVGGTPCQSFSVAGLRKGLADPRGNLALTYCAILDHLKPRWFVWENVPGVLSSGGGRDFGSFLGAVAELGYGWAYRVLDAQYFGVAQRRRRVFVVGYLGSWKRAAAVLFEPESLRGDPAPSRKARQAVAGCATHGIGVGVDLQNSTLNNDVVGTIDAEGQPRGNRGHGVLAFGGNRTSGSIDVTPALLAQPGSGYKGDFESETFLVQQPVAFHPTQTPISSADVCHSIGANENATAAVALPINTQIATRHNALGQGTGFGIGDETDPAFTLTKGHSHAVAHSVNIYGGNKRADRPEGGFYVRMDEYTSKTLDAASGLNPTCSQGGTAVLAPTLTASNDPSRSPQSSEITAQVAAVVQATAAVAVDCYNGSVGEVAQTIQRGGARGSGQVHAVPHAMAAMHVRRLTPVECERLQGFPDNYTAIPWRGKAETPDGPRYKALGNSMAVPVMAWIGKRIQESEAGNAS